MNTTTERALFAVSDSKLNYSAAEIFSLDPTIQYQEKKGWLAKRWKTIVLAFLAAILVYMAFHMGDAPTKAQEESNNSYIRPGGRNISRRGVLHPPASMVHTARGSPYGRKIPVVDADEFIDTSIKYILEPKKYQIYIEPFVSKNNMKFEGKVIIQFQVREQLQHIVIGASQLTINEVYLRQFPTGFVGSNNADKSISIHVKIEAYDREEGILNLQVQKPLTIRKMYELTILYKGDIQELPYGLFKSIEVESDTQDISWLIGFNMDIPFARTVFPCFDVPQVQSEFEIHIARQKDTKVKTSSEHWNSELTKFIQHKTDFHDTEAISKTKLQNAEKSAENIVKSNKEDWVWEKYTNKKEMPIQSLSFIITNYYKNTVSDKSEEQEYDFVVWTPNLDSESTQFVVKTGPKLILEIEDYFKIAPPVPYINLFGLPQRFPYLKSNLGSIYTSLADIFLKTDDYSAAQKVHVVLTLTAHLLEQWVENYINFEWHVDDWIKEHLVQYLKYVIVDYLDPSWNALDYFTAEICQMEMDIEHENPKRSLALVSWKPHIEHSKMHYLFPVNETRLFRSDLGYQELTKTAKINPKIYSELYEREPTNRGACIFRMIANTVTEHHFVTAIRSFFLNHKNQVISSNVLWESLAREIKNNSYVGYQLLPNHVSFKSVIEDWLHTEGYPILTVERNYESNSVTFKQTINSDHKSSLYSGRLLYFYIPISFTTEEKQVWSSPPRVWLNKVSQIEVAIDEECTDKSWILVNPTQSAFHRVNYDKRNWEMLKNSLKKNIFPRIIQSQLIDDAIFLGRKGYLDYHFSLDMMATIIQIEEPTYVVWKPVFRHLMYIKRQLSIIDVKNPTPRAMQDRKDFWNFVKFLIQSEFKRLYKKYIDNKVQQLIEADNKSVISHDDRLLLPEIFIWACAADCLECSSHARNLFDLWKNSADPHKENLIEGDLRYAVICSALSIGDTSDYLFLQKIYEETPNSNPYKYIYLKSLFCYQNSVGGDSPINQLISLTVKVNHDILTNLNDIHDRWQALSESFHEVKNIFKNFIGAWKFIKDKFSNNKIIMKTIVKSAIMTIKTTEEIAQLKEFKEQNQEDLPFLQGIIQDAERKLNEALTWQEKGHLIFREWISNWKNRIN